MVRKIFDWVAPALSTFSLLCAAALLSGAFRSWSWFTLVLFGVLGLLASYAGLVAGILARRARVGKIASALGLVLAVGYTVQLIRSFVAPLGSVEPVGRAESPPIRDYLEGIAARGFSGYVFASRKGTVVVSKGMGQAAVATPFTDETVFDIGSLTKQFTAAAILMLEQEGRLTVHDSIAQFFDGVPKDKIGITLHHLLTHTSGLRDNFGGDDDPVTRDDFVRKALKADLLEEPNKARHRYSNAGYSLLAAVVEIASGLSYDEYLRERLFDPTEMTRTGYRRPGREPPAHGYLVFGIDWGTPLDRPWAPDGSPYWNLRGNGGMLSTVSDLRRWHQALKVNRFGFSGKLFTPYVPEEHGGDSYYGYGWAVRRDATHGRVVGHNGSNLVFYASLQYVEDADLLLILASNRQTHLGLFYEEDLLKRLLR